jgi:DNA-3-methyladenine glycosylase II
MTFKENFSIIATAPFDFDLTAQIFSSSDKQIRTYTNGQFSQVIRLDKKLALVKLTSMGTVKQPNIVVELRTNDPLTLQDKKQAEEAVKWIFNLDFALNSFYEEIKNEPTMLAITQQLYGLKNPTTPTVFEALVDSIVEQQISIKVAITLEEKLTKKLGTRLELDEGVYFAFPTPQNLASARIEEIQQVGLSRRKAEYIQEAAKLIVNGKLDLEQLRNYKSPQEIISKLDGVRVSEFGRQS